MIGKILRTRGNALSEPTYWEVVRKKVETKRSDRDEIWELNSCSTPRCIRYRSTTELNKWYTEVEPMENEELLGKVFERTDEQAGCWLVTGAEFDMPRGVTKWKLREWGSANVIYATTWQINAYFKEVTNMMERKKEEQQVQQSTTPKCTTYRFSASSPDAIDRVRIARESLTMDEPVAIVWESGKFQIIVHEFIWHKAETHRESSAYMSFLYEHTHTWFRPKPGLLSWILKRIKEIKYGPYKNQRKVNVKVNVVRI